MTLLQEDLLTEFVSWLDSKKVFLARKVRTPFSQDTHSFEPLEGPDLSKAVSDFLTQKAEHDKAV